MDKRTLLAIALSILVLVVFSYLSPRKSMQKQAPPPQEKKEAEAEKQKQELPPAVEEAPVVPVEIPVDGKEIRVETDLYSAVFSTKGGTIKKWGLKEYADKDKNPVSLVAPESEIPPLSIILEGKSPDLAAQINYSVDKDSITFGGSDNSDNLTFFYTDSTGLSIRKMFTFYRDSYRVDFVTEVKGVPSYRVAVGSGFGVFDEKGTWVHIGPVLLKGSDKIDIDKNNIGGVGFIKRRLLGVETKSEVEYKGNIWWIAQEDKYFTSALASLNRDNDAFIWKWEKDNGRRQGTEIAYQVTGEKGEFLLYAGPKKYDILKPFGTGFEHIVDFGFFSIIARPLFWLLTVFYKVIGNYGWSIILLTIIVRIPFIPLINKGQRSMKGMQAIQPHMAAIKEKYKKDSQRMQREMMELYKKHKVNPMGGCWPMLVQIPVFFALYKILLIAIELRGAPFIWWIQDLSAKDPYYVFPILMGLTMIIQQKMTPATDPKQAKMMMLMPVVFTFMFLRFPSGLVIYWLVSNILGIAQQYFVNKKVKMTG